MDKRMSDRQRLDRQLLGQFKPGVNPWKSLMKKFGHRQAKRQLKAARRGLKLAEEVRNAQQAAQLAQS